MSGCTADHESLKGKFCPQCGESIISLVPRCSNGHEIKSKAKFCGVCGEAVKSNGAQAADNKNADNKNTEKKVARATDGFQNPNFRPQPSNESKPDTFASTIANSVSESSTSFQRIDHSDADNSKNKNLFIGLGIFGVAAALLLLVKLASGGAQPVTVTVEMTVINQQCSEISFGDSWGYSDIPGGQVLVKVDDTETFVGAYQIYGTTSALGCKFSATISGVKSDGENYSVSMASGRRGTVYSTRSELEANDWTFSLSLGRL